jgi:hypothetical protein
VVKIKHKIWLERDGKVVFGKGREELLKAIEECHSLNAAAKKLQMSYRAAWARLKASEDRAGIKLVESDGLGKKDKNLTSRHLRHPGLFPPQQIIFCRQHFSTRSQTELHPAGADRTSPSLSPT